jgi:hypothetical protein
MRNVLKQIWSGWKKVAVFIGRIQTFLLLTLLYFLVLAPMGLFFKLFGWDPLDARRSKLHKPTNWKPVAHGEPGLHEMRRQS